MNTFEFVVAISWVLTAIFALGLVSYLILSGRLKWLHYDSVVGKIGLEVTESSGIKDLTAENAEGLLNKHEKPRLMGMWF